MALQVNTPGKGVGAIFPPENEENITFPSSSMPMECCLIPMQPYKVRNSLTGKHKYIVQIVDQ